MQCLLTKIQCEECGEVHKIENVIVADGSCANVFITAYEDLEFEINCDCGHVIEYVLEG